MRIDYKVNVEMSEKSPIVTTINNNNDGNFSSDIPETSDLRYKLTELEMILNKIIHRLQSTWTIDMRSRFINPIHINDADKIIIINALPEIEALFLEKLRLCWLNFKTRFQNQMACNNFDYKSFCIIIENIEKELFSFGSMFNCTDFICNNSNDRKRFKFTNNGAFDESNILSNQIKLPQR